MNKELMQPRKRLDRGDLFWLAYMVFFFIEPLIRRSAVYWIECVGIAAVFVAIYVGFFKARRLQVRLLCIAAMAVLGAVIFPFNSGAIAFSIYAAALLPFVVRSVSTILIWFGIESAVIALEGWAFHNPYNAALGFFFVVVVGGTNIFFAQKQRADCKLRM